MRTTIVKVQIPLWSNDPDAMALVYGKGHKNRGFMPLNEMLLSAMNGAPKKFFTATISKDEININFADEVKDPGW